MMKWVQSGLSAVAGTAEPEYGSCAIHPVSDQVEAGQPVYRETTPQDFEWKKPSSTNVETQTFYFTCFKSGYVGFAQVIHSNVMGVHTTAQFTFKLFDSRGKPEDSLWTSTKLENFRTKGHNFYANNLSIELNEAGDVYTLKSGVTKESVVELQFSRQVPGVIFGKNGTTYYGDDVANPWGSMRHLFWPRCAVKGSINANGRVIDIDGLTMFVMALQGMKPHHAAKSWNFLNFHSENFTAVQMEFTTPKSYANTKVNIAILTSKDRILSCSINNNVVHHDPEVDQVGWGVPKSICFNYDGDQSKVKASVSGNLSTLIERVDVMAEIPQFVKNIVSGVAGAKPFIYQFCNDLDINVEGHEKETGIGYVEVTFISD